MKLLLIYPPFCNPSTFPFSISNLKGFIRNNTDVNVMCLDLNAKLHRIRFHDYYDRLSVIKSTKDFDAYAKLIDEFTSETKDYYSEWNKKIVAGQMPDMLQECFENILSQKPDMVAFSLVYNSQCFFAYPLMEMLAKKGVKCVCGGPAVNDKFLGKFVCLKNEIELVDYLGYKKEDYNCNTIPDYSDYNQEDYLAMEIIVPLKSCSACYYRQCAFCTHYKESHYFEYDIGLIEKTVTASRRKYFFFIDDMISRPRLIEISKIMKKASARWWCQLRPTKDLIPLMKELYDSGLRGVSWGVESGSQKMLDLMKKGTKVKDIEDVLHESKSVGIKNTTFILFGFPGEGKNEFLDTIEFLKRNSDSIDLCSTSVFGLQRGSKVFDNPSSYGVFDVVEHARTILNPKITYKVQEGLTQDEANVMVKKYVKTLRKLNKLPKVSQLF